MNKPLISVIVPVYNTAEYLKKTAELLDAQTYENMEFILVDDGSTDGSAQICDEICKSNNKFHVIHQKNSGVCAARNAGIEVAKGEYIGFCDSDDMPYDDMYETLYQIISENDCDVAMIKSAIRFIDGRVADTSDGTTAIYSDKDEIIRLFLLNKIQSSVYTKLFSAEICRQISFPAPHKINEDRFYTFSALDICKKLGYKSVTKYNYCRRDGSAVTQDFSDKYFDVIYFADLIEKRVCEKYPSLAKYARANTIVSYLRVCQLMVLLNGEKKYSEKFEQIRTFIKKQNRKECKQLLDKNIYLKFMLLRTGRVPFRVAVKKLSKF